MVCFARAFGDAVESRFWAGDVTASKLINGFVTADIAIETRRIDG
jgi:hypothetical protein